MQRPLSHRRRSRRISQSIAGDIARSRLRTSRKRRNVNSAAIRRRGGATPHANREYAAISAVRVDPIGAGQREQMRLDRNNRWRRAREIAVAADQASIEINLIHAVDVCRAHNRKRFVLRRDRFDLEPIPGEAPVTFVPSPRPTRNIIVQADIAVMGARGRRKVDALPTGVVKRGAFPARIVAGMKAPWPRQQDDGSSQRNALCRRGRGYAQQKRHNNAEDRPKHDPPPETTATEINQRPARRSSRTRSQKREQASAKSNRALLFDLRTPINARDASASLA